MSNFYKPWKPGKCSAQQPIFFHMLVWTVLIEERFDVSLVKRGASEESMCILFSPQIRGGKDLIGGSAEDSHLMSFMGNNGQRHRHLSKNGLGFSTIQWISTELMFIAS